MWNYFILKLSYWYSVIRRQPHVWAMPFALSAETVRGCNLNCSHCPAGALKGEQIRFMPEADFRQLIDRMYRKTFYLQLWFQGEPLLHPDIGSLVACAQRRKMYTVIATNAVLLTEDIREGIITAGLRHLIVSVDVSGRDADFFVGGNYNTAMENIRKLSALKKQRRLRYPIIEAQMVVTAYNEKNVSQFKREMKNSGADKITLKTAWFADLSRDDLPFPDRYSRYRKKAGGGWEPVKPIRNRCRRIFSTLVVTHNGDVVPCCFDKGCQYVAGNVLNEDPVQVWRGQRFMDFRRSVLKNRKGNAICVNCTE